MWFGMWEWIEEEDGGEENGDFFVVLEGSVLAT